jgi:hypothetical protein
MEWHSTYGGPAIFMGAARALSWRGTADSGSDYDEACRVSDVGASSDSGAALLDETTLLLSEPAPTRVFEAANRFAIVQCIAAASDDIVLPDELPVVDTGMRIAGGEYLLADAAEDLADVEGRGVFGTFTLPARRYAVHSACLNDDETELLVYALVPASE